MTHNQYLRLVSIESSIRRRFRPVVKVASRRTSKHTSTNKVYKNSRVIPQVWVEKVFNHPSWSSWPSKQY